MSAGPKTMMGYADNTCHSQEAKSFHWALGTHSGWPREGEGYGAPNPRPYPTPPYAYLRLPVNLKASATHRSFVMIGGNGAVTQTHPQDFNLKFSNQLYTRRAAATSNRQQYHW